MKNYGNRPGELFIVSGPSGVGKGTICKEVLKTESTVQLSVSATTREPREGEVHGVNYFFLSKEEFTERIENNEFLEYAEVFGNFYGTPIKPVEEKLNSGIDVLLEIDVQGAIRVKENYPEGIFIFVLPPTLAELRRRLTNRGTDSPEVIEERLSKAMGEIKQMFEYDYFVVNDDLEEAVATTKAIILAEHHRVKDHGLELVRILEEEE